MDHDELAAGATADDDADGPGVCAAATDDARATAHSIAMLIRVEWCQFESRVNDGRDAQLIVLKQVAELLFQLTHQYITQDIRSTPHMPSLYNLT